MLRFAYETAFMGRAGTGPTLEDVLRHMEQLKPFLAQNTDVIQVVQAGFIGAWSEWHSSFHGLEKTNDSKRTILEKIVWMTPEKPVSGNYFKNQNGSPATRNVFDYIRDHLGYRLELQQLKINGIPAAGKEISLDLSLINRGFSTLFNEHPVYFVLIDEQDRITEFLTETNVHNFQPYQPKDPECKPLLHAIKGQFIIPKNLKTGKYRLGLWIPDGSERLKYNNRYAIRCANGDTEWWSSPDNKYGINILTSLDIIHH